MHRPHHKGICSHQKLAATKASSLQEKLVHCRFVCRPLVHFRQHGTLLIIVRCLCNMSLGHICRLPPSSGGCDACLSQTCRTVRITSQPAFACVWAKMQSRFHGRVWVGTVYARSAVHGLMSAAYRVAADDPFALLADQYRQRWRRPTIVTGDVDRAEQWALDTRNGGRSMLTVQGASVTATRGDWWQAFCKVSDHSGNLV